MFTIKIPPLETFNNETGEFSYYNEDEFTVEHTLRTIAAYEAATGKPYYDTKSDKDNLFEYLPYMIVKPPKDLKSLDRIPQNELQKLVQWMTSSQTATWFTDFRTNNNGLGGPPSNDTITAEIIYYWMTEYNIPFECDKWHINRLMTLIEVCARKKAPPQKMSKEETMQLHAQVNAQRRAERAARKKQKGRA